MSSARISKKVEEGIGIEIRQFINAHPIFKGGGDTTCRAVIVPGRMGSE